MIRLLVLFLVLPVAIAAILFDPHPASAALAMPEAVTSYRIHVRYDPATHQLRGRAFVTWYNTSPEPVPDLQLHLYLNAFKNLKSTYMRERMEDDHRIERLMEGNWGWIDITSLKLENGAELTEHIEFIAPDDGNPDDRTVARVELPRPVVPGDPLRFTVEFHARLPRPVDRSGWGKDFVLAAQWFPKLGVYEWAGRGGSTKSGWNCHQFHAQSEFYADFGDYDVQITVPARWKVDATGERVARHENVDGTASERFVQRGIHDFAWTASPRFEVHARTFLADREVRPSELAAQAWELDRTVDDVRLPDVQVTLLAFPGERRAVERAFEALFAAIKHYGLRYGPYPYDRLVVVLPPRDAEKAGGMEYPTFILGSPSFTYPSAFRGFEETLIHEFGHQYWYGMVASNEFEESWLDEGFTSYATARVVDRVYGSRVAGWRWSEYRVPGVEWHGLRLPWRRLGIAEPPDGWEKLPAPLFGVFGTPIRTSDLGVRRRRYLEDPATDDIVRSSWEYRSPSVYGVNSYSRPATVLATLERLAGQPDWSRVMRTYAEHYRFKHPTSRDFLATLEAVTQRDWDWFFEQFVWGHRRFDYAVAEVKSEEVEPQPGVYEVDGQRVIRGAAEVARERRAGKQRGRAADPRPLYRSEVVVERRGDAAAPVELKVYFADSTVVTEHWDGRYQWVRFRYEHLARVDSAVVDPEQKWLLDTDRLDNSRARRADRTAARRWTVHWLLWVQSFLQLVGWLA